MSEEYADPAGESEMRRRAAWLLAMLVIVAVLVVALMLFFLKGGGHHSASPTGPPLPTGPVNSPHPQSSTSSSAPPTVTSSNSTSSSTRPHKVHCPTDQTCVAQGDAGNLVAAINAYREQHGQSAVSGSVSDAAKTCAMTNGDQCTGDWAESEVPAPDGQAALQKIIPLSHGLLDSDLSGLEVGWAYSPSSRLYYFAVITDS